MLDNLFDQPKKRILLFTFITAIAGFTVFGVLNTASASHSDNDGGGGSEFMGGRQQGDVKSVAPQNVTMDEGTIVTNDQSLTVYVEFAGSPTHYQICEDNLFKTCEWKRLRFDGKITFTLSEGAGLKKVYLRARFLGRPGKTKVLNVKYVPR